MIRNSTIGHKGSHDRFFPVSQLETNFRRMHTGEGPVSSQLEEVAERLTSTGPLEIPCTPSAAEQKQLQEQGIYGFTKKLFDYISGNNTPVSSEEPGTGMDGRNNDFSAMENPLITEKNNPESKVCLLLSSPSQSSLNGFAQIVRSESVDDFIGETLGSQAKSASLQTLHSYSMQSTTSLDGHEHDQSTSSNVFHSVAHDSSEEECLFAANTESSVSKDKTTESVVDYDDGEVIVNMRARPASVQSGEISMPPALDSLQKSPMKPVTPVKLSGAAETVAIDFGSPQLLLSPGAPVEFSKLPESPLQNISPVRSSVVQANPIAVDLTTPVKNSTAPAMAAIIPPTLSSVLKYNEKDVGAMKREWQQQHEKELEILHEELQKLDAKHRLSEESRAKMKNVVNEFEAAMAKMIDDSRQDKERHTILMEKMTDERNRVQTELKTVESAFKDLRVRHEETKTLTEQYRKNETVLRQTIEKIQLDVKSSEQRVTAVKDHAEKKLKEANEEINRVQAASETEITLLKAKLQKSDLKLKALEQSLEQKQAENKELMGICDDLIKKIEGKS